MKRTEKKSRSQKRFYTNRTDVNYTLWRQAALDSDQSYKTDTVEYFESLCKEASQKAAKGDTKAIYSIVKLASGKVKSNTASQVKRLDGSSPNSKEETLADWATYFNQLLNNPSPKSNENIAAASNSLPIDLNDFTMAELEKALQSCSLGKSPGEDHLICIESLRFGGPRVNKALLEVCNAVLNNSDPPQQWRTNIIIPVPKKRR